MWTHAASVALYPNLAYKPDEDFAPIGQVASFPFVVATRKDFPASNLKEFMAYVKANDAKLNQGHAGVGSMFFTSCLLLNSLLGTKPTLVPFSGGAPAMNALVGGQTRLHVRRRRDRGPVPTRSRSSRSRPQTQCGDPERAERCGSRAS
jgi:tripartite-type tricarboxylate transporter receptor subunit TctC